MVTLAPVGVDDLERVAAFLHQNMGGRITPETWRAFLARPWLADPPNHGFMLVEEGNVVGTFLATYSEQLIRGKPERFCNIHTWCVVESHRGRSMELLRALLAQEGHHFFATTANPNVARILAYRKFVPVQGEIMVLLNGPRPTWGKVETRPERIREVLPAGDRKSYDDHRDIGFLHHLALGQGKSWCYVVFKLKRMKRMPSARILHASSGECFIHYYGALANHLLTRYGAVSSQIESRFLPWRPPFAIALEDRQPTFYLSPTLEEGDFSNLYSELVGLDL